MGGGTAIAGIWLGFVVVASGFEEEEEVFVRGIRPVGYLLLLFLNSLIVLFESGRFAPPIAAKWILTYSNHVFYTDLKRLEKKRL